jgi:PAS domain S-box-containing protein
MEELRQADTMLLHATVTGSYDPRLVTLSVLIAIFAAYAALDLAGRLTTAARGARIIWIVGGSVSLGSGIWAMHYVGMAAYRLPIPVTYDWPTVVLSLLAAIFASTVALFSVSRPTMSPRDAIVGSLFMGGGIVAMHYIGMAAMRLSAMCQYSTGLVVLSILVAVGISFLGIHIVFSLRENTAALGGRKLAGAIALGLAIPLMHYIGMVAVTFVPTAQVNGSLAYAVSVSDLGLTGITTITAVMLGLAVYSSQTDRRLVLQAQTLAESRSQVQTIFDNLQEGIVVLDRDRRVVQINEAAIRILGLSNPSTYYEEMEQAFDVRLRNGTPLPIQQWPSSRALKGEFLSNFELEFHRKQTGAVTIVEVGTAPIKDRSGRVVQIILSYRDITKPSQIDEARSRLAAIVESSEDAIISKDMQGIVTSWNTGAEKVFGYTTQEMIGQSIKRLLPMDRLEEEDDFLARVGGGELIENLETVRRTKTGKFIHVSLSISPLRDAAGKIVGASEIARNITDRKQFESRLVESQKMEAIGQLTGGIAHDFNNLLSIVIGNLDLLERLVTADPMALKRVQSAQKAAGRGADLTRRLLAFSSREQLRPALVRIEEPIQSTLELAARAIGPEINITTDYDPNIPPVFVDAGGLESALLNLMVNARDAMPRGGNLAITTQLADLDESHESQHGHKLQPGSYACVSVSDTGQGMSYDTVERAFEPFFTTKERGKGTGLGLAMVYGFFKQSGGAVRIYSEVGFGTTVSFYLPVTKGEVKKPTPTPSILSVDILPSATVLIVDDEIDLLDIAQSYLTDAGYSVLAAPNGASALEIVRQHPEIDLVVTDIIMPGGMTGVDLSHKAHRLRPDLNFIYCSGFPAGALSERDMPLVDGPLLRKPYQRSELIALVRRTLLRRAAKLAASPPVNG